MMLSASILSLLFGGEASARDAWSSAKLPPPPRAQTHVEDVTLHLELVVNSLPTGKVVPVRLSGGHYHIVAADLRSVDIEVEGSDFDQVQVDTIPDVRISYDPASLRLLIDVPTGWLPEQNIGSDYHYEYNPARSSPGLLVNYDAYFNDSDRGAANLSVWNEVRFFGPFGAFSTTGVYRVASGEGSEKGFRRYDTYWRHSDEQRMLTYEAGDLLTRSLNWGSTIRIGGVQLSRDFAIRPDVITYPLPKFAGDAAVPSAVDLFINGYRAEGAEVKPGPFTLTNVPFVNGAGEAVVVVTDALGRQVSTTIPFYVSNDVLRQGLSDFSVSAGFVRRDYGRKNFSYGAAAGSASLRHGLTDTLTLELHGEAGEGFGLGGVGGVFRLGNLGTANASFSHSRYKDRSGSQWTVGYQYRARNFSIAARHSNRSKDFADLSVYDGKGFDLNHHTTAVTGSASIDRFGSIGAGYFHTQAHDGTVTQLANLSWGLPLWGNASLYASGNHEIGSGNWSGAIQFVMPFGRSRGTASAGYEYDNKRGSSWRASYNRSVPSDGGVGWNLAYADGSESDRYLQADVAWRNDLTELRGGMYGAGGNYTRWASASGSVVMMGGSTFVANRVSDAFAVVSTNGEAGVPVRYENQLVGVTNGNGHLLVPWASSYYAGRYSIDPLGLPVSADIPLVEQRVAVRRGSGYLLEFPMSRVVAATIKLRDAGGTPLPVGTAVAVNGRPGAYVGWDGIAYIVDVQAQNRLVATLPDGSACVTSFEFDDASSETGKVKPLTCLPENRP